MTRTLDRPVWRTRRGYLGIGLGMPLRQGGAPVIPFVPTDITGMQLWLKSDTGAFQDDAKTIPCTADGQAFRGWADQSGQNTNVNSAAAANPFTYQTNVLNGKPALRCRAPATTAMFITNNSGAFANVPGITGFIVLQTAALASLTILLNVLTNLGGGRFQFERGLTTANSDGFRTRRLDADAFDVRGASAGAVYTPATYYYLGAVADYAGGGRYLYRNGVLLDSVTGLSAGNTSNTNASAAEALGSGTAGADIAEVIFYNSALSTVNRQAVETYLAARYAL